MKRTILYLFALMLSGCFKSVGYETDVILKSWVQAESSGELAPATGIVAHAFEADTMIWTIASYEDALNGVLTRKGSGERGVAPVNGVAIRVDSVDMDLLSMHVSSSPVIIVAVDTENRLYGYRQQDLGENLPQLYTSVIFRPWKELKKYVDGSWRMINEFYTETPEEPENPGGTVDPEDPDGDVTDPENPGGGTEEPETPGGTVEPGNPDGDVTDPENLEDGTEEPETPGGGTEDNIEDGAGTATGTGAAGTSAYACVGRR